MKLSPSLLRSHAMEARLRVFLNAAANRTLFELRTATTVPQQVKDRAEVNRLSHQSVRREHSGVF